MSWDMLPQTQAINLKNNDLHILKNDGLILVQGDLESHLYLLIYLMYDVKDLSVGCIWLND